MRTILLPMLVIMLIVSLFLLVGCPKSEAVAPDDAAATPPGPPSPQDAGSGGLSIDIPENKPSDGVAGSASTGPDEKAAESGAQPPAGGPPAASDGAQGGSLPEGWTGGRQRGGDESASGDGERRPRRDPAQMFADLDKNSDGKLTKDELPERFAERMMGADTNGDGALTKGELEQARRNRRSRGGDGPPRGDGE